MCKERGSNQVAYGFAFQLFQHHRSMLGESTWLNIYFIKLRLFGCGSRHASATPNAYTPEEQE